VTSQPLAGTWIDVEVPTHVAGVLELAAGPVATLVASFDVPATRYRWIEVYGTEGTLSVPDPNTFSGPVQIRHAGETEWTDMPLSHGNAQQSRGLGLADMVRAERSHRPHRASGDLALHVLEVMERLLLAAERGSHQEVASTVDRPAPLPPGLLDDATGD
jgi:predicted dehydrogenase